MGQVLITIKDRVESSYIDCFMAAGGGLVAYCTASRIGKHKQKQKTNH